MHLPTLLTAVAPLAALLATPAEAHAPSRARSHVAAAHRAAKLDTSSSSSFVHDAPDHALLAKRAPRRRKTTCSPSSGAPTPSAPVLIVSPTSTKSLTPTPTSSKAAAPAPTEDKYNSKWKLDLVAVRSPHQISDFLRSRVEGERVLLRKMSFSVDQSADLPPLSLQNPRLFRRLCCQNGTSFFDSWSFWNYGAFCFFLFS